MQAFRQCPKVHSAALKIAAITALSVALEKLLQTLGGEC